MLKTRNKPYINTFVSSRGNTFTQIKQYRNNRKYICVVYRNGCQLDLTLTNETPLIGSFQTLDILEQPLAFPVLDPQKFLDMICHDFRQILKCVLISTSSI